MKQQTIGDMEYSAWKRKTKREEFIEIMDEIIPQNGKMAREKALSSSGDGAFSIASFYQGIWSTRRAASARTRFSAPMQENRSRALNK